VKQICFLLIILEFLAYGCKKGAQAADEGNNENKVEQSSPVTEVEAVILKKDEFSKEMSANGKVSALKKVDVRTKLNEPVLKIMVRTGQKVKAGEVIAVLDTLELYHTYLRQKVVYEKARIDFSDKLVALGYSEENIGEMPEELRKNARMRSGIELAETDFTIGRNNYMSAFIKAPIDGIVANMDLNEGNYPENGLICTIIDNRQLKVDFFILEEESMLVSKNLKVDVSPFYNGTIKEKGTITAINPTVDNGLINVSARIDGNNPALYDGVTVKVYIKSSPKKCLSIPKEAVVLRTGKKVVFTYCKGEQVSKWNYVTTEEENSTHVVVTEGLKELDTVIVSGNLHLGNDVPCVVSDLE
jgi:membrane fusion protein, multidrug efflux system